MERIFAIGDIHGCIKTFEKLLFEKIQIQEEDSLYCIGDYIDRGTNSKAVIDVILQMREEQFSVFTLRGNHEQMLLDALAEKENLKFWIQNGGSETIKSFGIGSLGDLPKKYIEFFKETRLYLETEKFIFVHAGLNFSRENIFEDKEAMLWSRDLSSSQLRLGDKLLIHGHTPKSLKYILNQKGNCINIDGGCVYRHLTPFGNLVAIDLVKNEWIYTENCD